MLNPELADVVVTAEKLISLLCRNRVIICWTPEDELEVL